MSISIPKNDVPGAAIHYNLPYNEHSLNAIEDTFAAHENVAWYRAIKANSVLVLVDFVAPVTVDSFLPPEISVTNGSETQKSQSDAWFVTSEIDENDANCESTSKIELVLVESKDESQLHTMDLTVDLIPPKLNGAPTCCVQVKDRCGGGIFRRCKNKTWKRQNDGTVRCHLHTDVDRYPATYHTKTVQE